MSNEVKVGDRFERVGETFHYEHPKGCVRTVAGEHENGRGWAFVEGGPSVGRMDIRQPEFWRRLSREAICGACLGVDGCAKCKPKPALTVPRRAHSVADLREGMRIRYRAGTADHEYVVHNGGMWGYVDDHRPPFLPVTVSYAVITIIAEPAAVEAPKRTMPVDYQGASATLTMVDEVAKAPAAEMRECRPNCTVGAPCRRSQPTCKNAITADRREDLALQARGGASSTRWSLPRRPIDTAASDPLAAMLAAPGMCVMRGRRGL